VSFEAIINMALVRNGMDDYVRNFSWDDSAERRQETLQNLLRGQLLQGKGNHGCKACNTKKLVSDMAGRKLKKKGKIKCQLSTAALNSKVILKDEQTSGAHVDSIANPNEQMSGHILMDLHFYESISTSSS
jgi:hypothetical protein